MRIIYETDADWFTDGQPESIVQDIENMVRSYIEKVIIIRILNFKDLM